MPGSGYGGTLDQDETRRLLLELASYGGDVGISDDQAQAALIAVNQTLITAGLIENWRLGNLQIGWSVKDQDLRFKVTEKGELAIRRHGIGPAAMMFDHWTERVRLTIGDMRHPDDPRGREITASVFAGIPTGEFDATFSGPAQYGSWGFALQIWYWGISFCLRGPIVGHYPPEENEEEIAS